MSTDKYEGSPEFFIDLGKLWDLVEKYGIDENSDPWFHLALKLADHYEPDFRSKRKRGQKTKWSNFVGLILVVEVMCIQNSAPQYVESACRELLKLQHWKLFGSTNEVMRRKYYTFRKSRFVVAARKSSPLLNDLDTLMDNPKWRRFVSTQIREALNTQS